MRDAAIISAPATQHFASTHGLTFCEEPPALLAPMRLHPSEERALAVAGLIYDRHVQRFVTPHYVIATMALPGSLPLLQLMPRVAGFEMETLYGQEFRTGDDVLDSRWRFAAEDLAFAGSLLNHQIREVLHHDAAAGSAIVIDGAVLYHWQPIPVAALSEARTHLDLLAAVASRIDAVTWQSYGVVSAPPTPAGSVPPVPPSGSYSPAPSVTFAAPQVAPASAPLAGTPATTDSVALTGTGVFLPEGDEVASTDSGWIGGDEVDQSHMYYTGPRLKGQARPRV